jgi:predicted ATP-dependent endonuclease of OLD family
MKIKKFRIRNYKSIIDSGDCYLQNDLTILAGKNESGKSSILEALADFNSDKLINENAIPISDKDHLPEISLTLALSIDDQLNYYKKKSVDQGVNSEIEVTVTKTYPNKYSLDNKAYKLFELNNSSDDTETENIRKKIQSLYLELSILHSQLFRTRNVKIFPLNVDDIQDSKLKLDKFVDNFNLSYKRYITNPNQKQVYLKKLTDLKSLINEYQNVYSSNKNEPFFELLPNFVLFKSFDDLIPNEIAFDKLETSEFVKDLEIISDLNVALIKSNDNRNKLRHQSELNLIFNKEYIKYWAQDTSEFKIYWDNDILQFWIVEDGLNFKPQERSKGKQWHLSFYTKISARATESMINVILIDEPGLYLHATAQKDVYNKLLNLSSENQIIYTTHSPYLINRDQLNRVRLVVKNYSKLNGTIIENKIHSKADKETLTPILTAIGLELSDGIQNIGHIKNIVVEGPSDYFYLQGLKILLKNDSFNVIFGGGAGNMGNIGTILTGWGCKVIYLYDNDRGKKDGSKNLIKNWLVRNELILAVKEEAGSIEDIFSRQDFKKYILNEKVVQKDLTNSEFIKKTGQNKVLLASQFNSLCQTTEITLTTETISTVRKLFEKIETAF